MQKRLSPGQKDKEDAGSFHFLRDPKPLGAAKEPPAPPQLLAGEPHVAHPAVEVAQRRQLQRTGDGKTHPKGTFNQHLFNWVYIGDWIHMLLYGILIVIIKKERGLCFDHPHLSHRTLLHQNIAPGRHADPSQHVPL